MPFPWIMVMYCLHWYQSTYITSRHRPQLFRIPECEDNCEIYSSVDLFLRNSSVLFYLAFIVFKGYTVVEDTRTFITWQFLFTIKQNWILVLINVCGLKSAYNELSFTSINNLYSLWLKKFLRQVIHATHYSISKMIQAHWICLNILMLWNDSPKIICFDLNVQELLKALFTLSL